MDENNNFMNEPTNNDNLNQNNFANSNQNNFNDLNQNNSENNEIEEQNTDEKKQYYWIFYIIMIAIIFGTVILLLRGCNTIRNKKYSKIISANDWVTNMWNKCVDPIYWYTVDGTGINGAPINIDAVISDCDNYYNEYKSHSEKVNSLGAKDSEFKEYYNKIMEQVDVIYPKIKESKPIAKTATDYEENMEIFYNYQVKLYDLVKEKYSGK